MSVASPTPTTASARWWRDRRHLPWWRIPLYPAVFLPAMVLLTWSQTGAHPAIVARPSAIAVAASLLLTLLFAVLVKDRDRAGLAASALLIAILALDDRAAALLVIATVAILVEGLAHRGRPAIVASIATQVMSAVATILLVATVITLTMSGTLSRAVADLAEPPLPPAGAANGSDPDIYVFLLDAFPGDRAAALAGDRYDPDAFPEALESRGFDVDRDSHSNYLLTPLTLASMLSMRHLVDLDALDPPFTSRGDDWYRLRHQIEAAPAFAALRDAGYRIDTIDASYAHAQDRRVDRFVEQPGPNELELVLAKYTRLEGLVERIAPGTMAQIARDRVGFVYDTVGRLATEPADRPRLVFAHVPAPHPPWVFGAQGQPRDPGSVTLTGEPGATTQQQLDAGFDQATYIADRTIRAIDQIRASTSRPPVIVVMSDHGPGVTFSTSDPLAGGFEVRASNFMAAATPGHPDLIGDHLTPVNLFATLLDAYLDDHFERQPDSIWAWLDSYLDATEAPPITGWPR